MPADPHWTPFPPGLVNARIPMIAYTPEQTARTEAFTHAGLVHYRDQFGQIGRHRPADPKCPCNPTKEKP